MRRAVVKDKLVDEIRWMGGLLALVGAPLWSSLARADDGPPPTSGGGVLFVPGAPPPPATAAPTTRPTAPSPPSYEPPLPPPPPVYPRSPRSVPEEGPGHVRAPELALWLGVRGGWDFPAGPAFADAAERSRAENSFVRSGPVAQIDLGARVMRKLVPFVFYAHTFGRNGTATTSPGAIPRAGLPAEPPGGYPATVDSARSELLGLGMRYLFSPDDWGAAVEISYAYRLTRATFSDGTTYRANAPGLVRLAAGLELRPSRAFTWSPMLVATVGSYADVTVARPGATERSVMTETQTHAYFSLVIGGAFDLFPRWEASK
jgi:hypothetical protein